MANLATTRPTTPTPCFGCERERERDGVKKERKNLDEAHALVVRERENLDEGEGERNLRKNC